MTFDILKLTKNITFSLRKEQLFHNNYCSRYTNNTITTMFKRKLQSLDYPAAENVNINNVKEFRSIVLWLEDQKIRTYKIEDRQGLRQLDSDEWNKAYDKYKNDIACPITSGKPAEELHWILGYAVRLEYCDNKDKYNQKIKETDKTSAPNVVPINPLDNLEFNSPDFIKGINDMAKILKISPHPNHLVTLEAIRKVVCKRLSTEALENPNKVIVQGTPFPFENADAGLGATDPVLNKAAKILRLLHIQNLRQLQTLANELIVAVQVVTANPKTDTKLGQVGK